ncbi:MAG: hypothetical protein H0U73_05125 [Tatlockia sp.]|nr:hypothetical protein [Tatlockia sp.]
MFRTILIIALTVFANLVQALDAASFYQIDLIVFTHQQASIAKELSLKSTLTAGKITPIPLLTEASKNLTPYHLLPSSSSQLREEYWALHRKPQFQVLLHYTWLQPLNSQSAISIPKIEHKGFELEGTLRIQRSNYYLLDSELLIATPDSNQTPFVFTQKQRLKGGSIYYLDHPLAGMLIKIHQLGTA